MKSLPFLFLLLLVGAAYAYYSNVTPAPEMARCIDYQDRVVSNVFCQVAPQTVRLPGSLSPVARYRRYYGGYGAFDSGSIAWGGSNLPLAGHIYRDARGDDPIAAPSLGGPAPAVYLGAARSGH